MSMKRGLLQASLGLSAAVFFVLAIRADGPGRPATAPGDKTEFNREGLTAEQKLLADKYKKFEQSLLTLKQRLERSTRKEDRDKAALLEKVLERSRTGSITTRFNDLVKFLGTQRLNKLGDANEAVRQSAQLAAELKSLLELLRGNVSTSRKEERLRLENLLKELDRVIREQKIVAGKIEDGKGDPKDTAQNQRDVRNDTNALNKKLGNLDKDGKGGDKGGEAKDNKGEAKEGKGKGAKGESKDAGKGGEGKKGDGKDGGKGDKGNKGEAKQGNKGGKAGQPTDKQGQKGEAKQGGKSGDKQGDAKGSKGGDGKKGSEAKGSKGGDGKQGGSKDAGAKGDDKQGQAKGEKNKVRQKPEADGDKQGSAKKGADKSGDKQAGAKGGEGSKSKDSSQSKGGQQSAQQGQSKGSKSSGQGSPKSGGQQQQQPPQGDGKDDGQKKGGDQQDNGTQDARKRIKDAEDFQRQTEKKVLEQKKKREALDTAEKAVTELEKAKKKLEDLLRQLREEELERLLTDLKNRCERMLAMQEQVYQGTKAVARAIDGNADKKATRGNIQDSQNLSDDEKKIVLEASKAIQMLESEGSAVAFHEVFQQVREDMKHVERRLGGVDVGKVTQAIEVDIIDTLKEMIKALEKAKKELDDKKNPPKSDGGPPPPQADQKLLDKIAELKMIRAMQMRVNRRTELYGNQEEREQATDPNLQRELRNLSERQDRIFEVTNKIFRGDNQ